MVLKENSSFGLGMPHRNFNTWEGEAEVSQQGQDLPGLYSKSEVAWATKKDLVFKKKTLKINQAKL